MIWPEYREENIEEKQNQYSEHPKIMQKELIMQIQQNVKLQKRPNVGYEARKMEQLTTL